MGPCDIVPGDRLKTSICKSIPWFAGFCLTVCRFRYTNFCSERIRKLLTSLFGESDTTSNIIQFKNCLCLLHQSCTMTCYRSTQKHLTFGLMGCVRAFGRDGRARERESCVCMCDRVCVCLSHAHIHIVLNPLDFAWIILVVSPRLTWGDWSNNLKKIRRRKTLEVEELLRLLWKCRNQNSFFLLLLKCGLWTAQKQEYFLSLLNDCWSYKNILV